MSGYLLGVDYGTGGAKVAIIDLDGRVVGYAFDELDLIHRHPGWSEHRADAYWPLACRLIRQALDQASIPGSEIAAIACSSALPSMVLVDRDHRPITDSYNLMDRRAVDQVQWLRDQIGEDEVFRISGNRLEDHPSLVNLMWEKAHRPEVYDRIWRALTMDGYISLELTGRATLNYSAAAFYGIAYDLRERAFDGDMLSRIGIRSDLLPDLVGCAELVGTVTPEAAEATGLAVGTPVAGGQVDCNAGWLGAGAISVGDIQSNLGTVGNFGIIHQNSEFVYSEVGCSMIHCAYTVDSENTYITIPTTTTGGQSLRFLRGLVGQQEMLMEQISGVNAYDLMNLEAERVPPGSEGLIALPYLMGERTPIWDVNARGVLFGLSLNHTKGHLVRAMMEGVAYALYDSFRLMRDSGLTINLPLILNEGGAKSALWRRIITDVFDVRTALVKRRTGAPYGDAILAGVAIGLFDDFGVAKEWTDYVEPMEPDKNRHARYMECFDLFKRIYEHTKEDMAALAQLRAVQGKEN